MDEDRISLRQLIALTFAALLSPAIRVLPGRTAQIAGEGGWLATLAALPALLALCWALCALLKGRGLGRAVLDILGPVAGRLVLALCLAWGVFLLAANARLAALRFLSVSYRNAPLPLFLLALLGLALWLARKPVRVLGRAGEVFYLALAAGLGFSLALGAFQTDLGNLLADMAGTAAQEPVFFRKPAVRGFGDRKQIRQYCRCRSQVYSGETFLYVGRGRIQERGGVASGEDECRGGQQAAEDR